MYATLQRYKAEKEAKAKNGAEKMSSGYATLDRYGIEREQKAVNGVGSRIKNWLKSSGSFIEDYNRRTQTTSLENYVSDSQSWLDEITAQKNDFDLEADSILAVLNNYGKHFDEEWVREVNKALDERGKILEEVIKGASGQNDYWKQFGSAEEYEKLYDNHTYSTKYDGKTYSDILTALESASGREKTWLTNNADSYMTSVDAQAEIDKLSAEIKKLNNEESEIAWGYNPKGKKIDDIQAEIKTKRGRINTLKGIRDTAKRHEQVEKWNEQYSEQVAEFNEYFKKVNDYIDWIKTTSSSFGISDRAFWATNFEPKSDPSVEEKIKNVLNDLKGNTNNSNTDKVSTDLEPLADHLTSQNFGEKSAYVGLFPNSEYSVEERLELENAYKRFWDSTTHGSLYGIEGGVKNRRYLESSEKDMYSYLLYNYGEGKADEYLEDIQWVLDKRATDALNTEIQKDIKNTKGFEGFLVNAAYSLATIPANIIGGVTSFLDNTAHQLSGESINPYSDAQSLRNFANTVRGEVGEEIADKVEWEIFGQNVMQNVYNAGMSAADSVVGAYTMGSFYTVVAGSGAAANQAAELYERGASNDQIFWGSIAAGTTELLTEKYSIDNLLKMKNPASKAQIVKEIFKQAGIEASEELASEIVNTLADSVIMANNSELSNLIEMYENGYYDDAGKYHASISHEDAVKKAHASKVSEIFWAAAQGFLSGGMSGGISTTAQAVHNVNVGKNVKKLGDIESLLNAGFATEDGSQARKIADMIQNRVSKGKAPTSMSLGALKATTLDNIVSRANAPVVTQDGIADALREFGVDESDIPELSRIINKAQSKALTEKEINTLKSNEAASSVMSLVTLENNFARSETANTFEEVSSLGDKNAQKGKAAFNTKTSRTVNVSEDGVTRIAETGEAVKVADVASVDKNGDVYLKLENGQTVNMRDISFSSDNEASLYEQIASYDLHPSVMKTVIDEYDASLNISPAEYLDAASIAYTFGKYNIPKRELSEALPEAVNEHIYKLGQVFTENKAKQSEEKIKAAQYEDAEINEELLELTSRIADGESVKANEKVYFGTVSSDIAARIQELTGVDVHGFKIAIEARQIEHILNRHGKNGKQDKSLSDINDVSKIEYVLKSPDNIEYAGKAVAYQQTINGKNRSADTVLCEKDIGGKSYYVVEAVPDTKAKTLYVVTAFIEKKGYKKGALQTVDAKGPGETAKTDSKSAPKVIVSQHETVVNSKGAQNATEDAGTLGQVFTENKAKQSEEKIKAAEKEKRISARTSESERAEILKRKVIKNVPVSKSLPNSTVIENWSKLNDLFGKHKREIIKKLASEFGVFKSYFNDDISVEFEFSKNSFDESYSKQKRNYEDFAKMVSVFDDVVKNAVGIEAHLREDYKPDPTLKNVFVLMSAYLDGDYVVPVKLEVKEFSDKSNKLYVAVTTDKIKIAEVRKQGTTENGVAQNSRSATLTGISKQGTTENGVAQNSRPIITTGVSGQGTTENGVAQNSPPINISITELMKKVNPEETSFTKYFPDSILTDAQRAALEEKGYKKEASQLIDAKGPNANVHNGSASASGNIVAQSENVVNSKDMQNTSKNAGKLVIEKGVKAYHENQKYALSVLNLLAKRLGLTIHVYKSEVVDGKRVYKRADGTVISGKNGWYDTKTSEIWLDINAGTTGQGLILFTASHELVHFIRQWSETKFKVLADFLMEKYGDAEKNVDELIHQQMSNRGIGYDEAYEEMIASSMEAMLKDGKVLEKLAELKKKDHGIVQKIRTFLKNFAAKLKAAYEGIDPATEEGRFFAEMTEEADRIAGLFAEALHDAGENLKKTDVSKFETSEGLKYSNIGRNALIADRLNSDGWLIGKDGKERYEISDSDMKVELIGFAPNPQHVRDYVKHDLLFEAYPDIKDYRVIIRDHLFNDESRVAAVSYKNKTIYLKRGLNKDEAKAAFLHEFQHIIQRREGFVGGTNKNSAGWALFNRVYDEVKNSTEFNALKTAEAKRKYVVREIERQFGETFDVASAISYWNYYGEVEARNTADRRDLDEAGLAENPVENDGEIYDREKEDAKFIDNLIEIGYTEKEANKFKKFGVDSYDNQQRNAGQFDMQRGVMYAGKRKAGLVENGYDDGSQADEPGRRVHGGRGVRGADTGRSGNSRDAVNGRLNTEYNHEKYSSVSTDVSTRGLLVNALESATENEAEREKLAYFETNKKRNADLYKGKNLHVDGEIYSYDFMTALDPMRVDTMPPLSSVKENDKISQEKAVSLGLENAKRIGRQIVSNQYVIKNAYTGREIVIGKNGLNHSLDASNIHRLRTNARLSAIGGYIVQNAVPINGLVKKNPQADGTYAMACLVNDGSGYVVAIVTVDEFSSRAISIDFSEVTHSINGRFLAKKEDSRSSTRELDSGQASASTTAISEISIADFLEIVNGTHRSLLSDDVLRHFNEDRPENGYYSGKILFSDRDGEDVSTRGLLVNALESAAKSDAEREKLAKYKAKIADMEALENRLKDIDRQIHEISFSKDPRDKDKLRYLQDEKIKTVNRIEIAGRQLLRLEGAKELQDIAERQREAIYSETSKKREKTDVSKSEPSVSVKRSGKGYVNTGFAEYEAQTALYDALDHEDRGFDNLILVGQMPEYITSLVGIEGDFYVYRNHAYENMVSKDQAIKDGRYNGKAHYHDLGIETMTDAMMALNDPIMTISTKSKGGNPTVIMLLPVKGKNNAPLYAVLSFYSNKHINGNYSKKPHIVLTIAERDFFNDGGRAGINEVIEAAISEGRVLDFDTKKRDALSVIAKTTRLGNITESSLRNNIAQFRKTVKVFKEKNKILYSDRDGEDVSTRGLLVNALESAAESDAEREKLAKYKAKIADMEALENRLKDIDRQIHDLSFSKGPRDMDKSRALQEEKKDAVNRLNRADRRLLELENAQPLKDLVERERNKAYKRAKERANEQRERAEDKRKRTLRRNQIRRVVDDLNRLLTRPSKEKHVPIGLQKPVADFLSAIEKNDEPKLRYYDSKIEKLERELEELRSNPDTAPKTLIEKETKLSNAKGRWLKTSEHLSEILGAYKSISGKNNTSENVDPEIAAIYRPEIEERLQTIIEDIGRDVPLLEMTLSELDKVYSAVRLIERAVSNGNKMFSAKSKKTLTEYAGSIASEIETFHKTEGGTKKTIGDVRIAVNELTPLTLAKAIGSDSFTELLSGMFKSSYIWGVDMWDAKSFHEGLAEDKGAGKWKFDEKKEYTFSGEKVSLSLSELMSLYALSKRKKAVNHLTKGGFYLSSEKGKRTRAYKISEEELTGIAEILSDSQREFADEMQKYLSVNMGEKGNEAARQMYGIDLFLDENYFPMKVKESHLSNEKKDKAAAKRRTVDLGMTKQTVEGASSALIVSDFYSTWFQHVNDMSLYHGVTSVEDFSRVWNSKVVTDDGNIIALRDLVIARCGKAVAEYVDNLINDANAGIRVRDYSSTKYFDAMIARTKRAAVLGSLSVAAQQFSAIERAKAYIPERFFVKSIFTWLLRGHKKSWAEMKKYCPVAILKEIGGYDLTGRNTMDWVLGRKTWGKKVEDTVGKLPALIDEYAWCAIWEAGKQMTASLRGKNGEVLYEKGSKEFFEKASEIVTEAINHTQVYDSIFVRSGHMRSDNLFAKTTTMFMTEPTTATNMLVEASIDLKRGGEIKTAGGTVNARRFALRKIRGVVSASIGAALGAALVYAMRDDDEEKTFIEKYVGHATENIVDNLNPLNMIPIGRDIVSLSKGYDVERADMTLIADLIYAVNGLESDKPMSEKIVDLATAISNFTSIPLKNLIKDAAGLCNTLFNSVPLSQTTWLGIKESVYENIPQKLLGIIPNPIYNDLSDSDLLYEAMLGGSKKEIERIKARYDSESQVQSAIRKGLRENDPRIREAAKLNIKGDMRGYAEIVNEIASEKIFEKDRIIEAVNLEINTINRESKAADNEPIDEDETVTSLFNASMLNRTLDGGDTETALEMIDDMVNAKVKSGKTEQEAKSVIKSNVTRYWKEKYIAAWRAGDDEEMLRIRKLLAETKLYGTSYKVSTTVSSWLKDAVK